MKYFFIIVVFFATACSGDPNESDNLNLEDNPHVDKHKRDSPDTEIYKQDSMIVEDVVEILCDTLLFNPSRVNNVKYALFPVYQSQFKSVKLETIMNVLVNKVDEVQIWEPEELSDGPGMEWTERKDYVGTLPESGLHIYHTESYESGGHILADPETFLEVSGGQFPDMPIELPNKNMIIHTSSGYDGSEISLLFIEGDTIIDRASIFNNYFNFDQTIYKKNQKGEIFLGNITFNSQDTCYFKLIELKGEAKVTFAPE